jgi:serine/threonine-protein kinase RsbT
MTKSFGILARDFGRAGEISIQVQATLKKIGYDQDIIRRVSICAYESELNVVMYGEGGDLHLTVGPDEIVLDVVDQGPGIEDVEQAMQEGYSTAPSEYQELGFGAGMGLPNIKRNSDSLEIASEKGKGTHLRIGFKVR